MVGHVWVRMNAWLGACVARSLGAPPKKGQGISWPHIIECRRAALVQGGPAKGQTECIGLRMVQAAVSQEASLPLLDGAVRAEHPGEKGPGGQPNDNRDR